MKKLALTAAGLVVIFTGPIGALALWIGLVLGGMGWAVWLGFMMFVVKPLNTS